MLSRKTLDQTLSEKLKKWFLVRLHHVGRRILWRGVGVSIFAFCLPSACGRTELLKTEFYVIGDLSFFRTFQLLCYLGTCGMCTYGMLTRHVSKSKNLGGHAVMRCAGSAFWSAKIWGCISPPCPPPPFGTCLFFCQRSQYIKQRQYTHYVL